MKLLSLLRSLSGRNSVGQLPGTCCPRCSDEAIMRATQAEESEKHTTRKHQSYGPSLIPYRTRSNCQLVDGNLWKVALLGTPGRSVFLMMISRYTSARSGDGAAVLSLTQ